MTKKNLVLLVGIVLILIGWFKPNLPNFGPTPGDTDIVVSEPTDPEVLGACLEVAKALKNGSGDNVVDGNRLAHLYYDLASLIALDGEQEVITSTDEIREANRVAGLLSRMDLQGKYKGLAEAATKVIVVSIGDEKVPLSPELRAKAVSAFKALAWGCLEGAR